jgi:SNF2-related domain/Helicase conserved C-terminal domain
VVESSTFRLTRRFPKAKKHRDSNGSSGKSDSSSSSSSHYGSNSNGSSSSSSNGCCSSISSSSSSSDTSKCLFKFVIISYTLIPLMIESLEELNFKIVIADECHYLKNVKAARTKGLVILLRKSLRAVLLSGTPALSRPMELFTQLNALDPVSWPCIKAFGRRYCRTKRKKKGGFGAEFNGASNTQELHILLAGSLMIRRLKVDILSELPKKIRTIVRVEIEDQAQKEELAYLLSVVKVMEEQKKLKRQRVRAENRVIGLDNDDASDEEAKRRAKLPSEVFTKQNDGKNQNREFPDKKAVLLELFTKSGVAKVEGVIPHIGTFLDDIMSGKLLVFAHHRNVLDKIEEYLKERGTSFIRIDGGVQGKDRHGLVTHFQESAKCRVALLSITAAGVAITLTAASTVYFAEMYWTPGSLMQAEDRAHRIGQMNTVKVTYFLSEGSVDDILWPMVRAKIKVLGEVVEGNGSMDMSLNKGDPFEFHETSKEGGRISFANNEISGALKEIIADERAEVRKVKMEKKGHKSYQENANGVIDLDDDDDEDEGDGDTDDGDFSNIFKEDYDDCFSGGIGVKSENGGFGDDYQRSKRILPGSLGGKESADKGNGEETEGPDLLAQLYMAYQNRSLKGSSSSSSSSSSSTYYCSHNGTTNPNRMPSINNMTGIYPGSSGYINPAKNGINANGSRISSSGSNSGSNKGTAYRRSTEVITIDDCDSDDDNGSSSQAHDYQKQHKVQEENAKHVMNGSQSSHSSAVLSALRGLSNSTVKSPVKSEPMIYPPSSASVSRSGPQDVIDLIGDDDSDNDFLYSKPSFHTVRKASSPGTSSLHRSSEANLSLSASIDHKPSSDYCAISVVDRLPSPPRSQSMLPIDTKSDIGAPVETNEIQQEAMDIDLMNGDMLGSKNAATAASSDRTPAKNSSQSADSSFDNTSGRRRSSGEILDISSPPKHSNGSSNRSLPGEHVDDCDASHDSVESTAGGNRKLAQLKEFIDDIEISHTSILGQSRTHTGISSPPSHHLSSLSPSSSVSAVKSTGTSLNHVIIPSFRSHNIANKGQINRSVAIYNGEDPNFGSIKRDRSDNLADRDDDLIILRSPKIDIDRKVLHSLARSSMFSSINGADHPR